ncbi:peptide ABC transporter substrate-binding protein [Desulfonema ishimotonii]|uniref:Peptide ABC transporter substrate-binding protein n=1 Tax=Desulfonema ishimotonii TaxID=45657 RepID=A0A401FQ62_9BACT|nr:ABC transporter substrate-binding protein [Desulfonema ishimotonii]GBC59107.1 peptide ABC transporter substrate-binding protein [Desulfonema ishimotonii]
MRKHIVIMGMTILLWGLPLMGHAATFTDRSGHEIEIRSPFKRIISLYAAHTENLFALGLDEEIIGVTPYEVWPPEALKKPVFNYRKAPEKIIGARPDLVLIRPMIARAYPSFTEKLKQAGITVVSVQPVGIDDMYQYWRTLGILTGKEEEAEKMIFRFKKAIRTIRILSHTIPATRRKRVYFEAIHKKMKTFTPASMQLFTLTMAGGINIANDATSVRKSNIASYGKERILSLSDEIDVYLAQKGKMNRISPDLIRQEPGFQKIKAIKNGQLFIIDEHLVSRPTPRLIRGAVDIGHCLYPDIYTREIWQGIKRIMDNSRLSVAQSAYHKIYQE